jgi:hypothetical protein
MIFGLSSGATYRTLQFLHFRKTEDFAPLTTRPCRLRGCLWPAGYRVGAIPGHRVISFECAGLALGKQAVPLIEFFDMSRRKRNIIDYTGVQIATSTEAAEVLQRTQEFRDLVEAWIKAKHPQLG